MKRLTTFEDVFNKLCNDYEGHAVEITTKQNGVCIANFVTNIDKIIIQPLNPVQRKNWKLKEGKIGVMLLQKKVKTRFHTTANIPFQLGFNTMHAVFLREGVNIKTFNMEFNIKKLTNRRKQLA